MRTRLVGLVVCLLAAAVPAIAAEPSVDGKINASLRDVINRGREFYNAGDPAACYYVFEGALIGVRPLLDHKPGVQKKIDQGLADAARMADMRRRVGALRHVLDDVRSQVNGKVWTAPPPTAKTPDEPPPLPPQEVTLWSRLGGEAKVKQVVEDFVELAAGDPAVNFDRDGKLKLSEEQITAMKKDLVAFISQATGGPLKYTGKGMKELHKGLGVTNAEFDAAGANLAKALEKNGVALADVKALMTIVGTTRADIVEAKKPDDMPKEKGKDDEDKPKEKKKDDEDKPKEKKPKDDEDKPKEKKDKDDEDKPKVKKDKDDEDKPKEKEKIKKPKEDDEKKDDEDKPKEKEKIKKPKEDDEKAKDKDDEKPKEKKDDEKAKEKKDKDDEKKDDDK